MKPGMNRRARQKNAHPGERDERAAEKQTDDPTRIIIDPIHNAAPQARRGAQVRSQSDSSRKGPARPLAAKW